MPCMIARPARTYWLGPADEPLNGSVLELSVGVQDFLFEKQSKLERWRIAARLPWWAEAVIYVVVAAGWAVCIYITLLYGVTFTTDQVRTVSALAGPANAAATRKS